MMHTSTPTAYGGNRVRNHTTGHIFADLKEHTLHTATRSIWGQIELIKKGGNVTECFEQISCVLEKYKSDHVIRGDLLAEVHSLAMQHLNACAPHCLPAPSTKTALMEFQASCKLLNTLMDKFPKIHEHCSSFEMEFTSFQETIERYNAVEMVPGDHLYMVNETFVKLMALHIKVTVQNEYVRSPANHDHLKRLFCSYRQFLEEKVHVQEEEISLEFSSALHEICETMVSFENNFKLELHANAELYHETVSLISIMMHKFHAHLKCEFHEALSDMISGSLSIKNKIRMREHEFHHLISIHVELLLKCEEHVRIKVIEKLCLQADRCKELVKFLETVALGGIYMGVKGTQLLLSSLFHCIERAGQWSLEVACDVVSALVHLGCKLHEEIVHLMVEFSISMLKAKEYASAECKFALHILMTLLGSCRCEDYNKHIHISEEHLTQIQTVAVEYQYTELTEEVATYQQYQFDRR